MKSPMYRILEKNLYAVPNLGQLPLCSICNIPVPLETAKTDESGAAIHEECYTLKVMLQRATGST